MSLMVSTSIRRLVDPVEGREGRRERGGREEEERRERGGREEGGRREGGGMGN